MKYMTMRASLVLLLGLAVASAAPLVHREPLAKWRFSSLNGSIALTNVSTPGTSHMHLLEAGVINEDPYYRFNEHKLEWVAQTTWVYETELPQFVVDSPARIMFETLDGVAQVELNGQLLGPQAVNSFRPHSFVLPRSALRSDGINSLKVTFTPPLDYMKQAAKAYPYDVPATRNFNVWAEPTHRPFLRKAGSDFGWDWGPAYVTTGIAGRSYVEWVTADDRTESVAVELRELNVAYKFSGARGDFSRVVGNVTVVVDTPHQSTEKINLQLFIDSKLHGDTIVFDPTPSDGEASVWASHEVALPFSIDNPTLWWPVGYGSPHLYNITVQAVPTYEQRSSTSVLSHAVGFRTIEVVQDPTDAGGIVGATFYFRVNGVAVFAKGANWIPNDSFPTRVTPSKLAFLLQSVVAANMNMLRVWGGGRYESDAFYTACDQLGLLVWHEFMFACAMYPRDEPFLADVKREVEYQTRRLRKHTCIAIWGGNNENENMMASFAGGEFMPPGETFNRDVFVVDFTALFVDIVRPLVRTLDRSRPFVDTSPSNGLLSEDPYVKRWGGNTNDVAFGDVHFYDYSRDCQDPEMYPHARFVSEFGFQSMPSVQSLDSVSGPEDWTSFQAFWKLLKFRERHANGTMQMATQIARRFHVPFPFGNEAWLSTPLASDFAIDVKRRVAAYIYLTQIQQALCYETAIHTWRRGRHVSRGGTMGILYWQLNDVWQGTSWSSLEFSGQWKSLQYAVQRAYAPLLLTVHQESDDVVVYGVSDLPDTDVDVTIQVQLVDTRNGSVIFEAVDRAGVLQRVSSQPMVRWSVPALLTSGNCEATSCFLRLRCTTDHAGVECGEATYFFAPYKNLRLRHGSVKVESIRALDDATFDVTLETDGFVALFVEVYVDQWLGHWDRNVIHLVGGEKQTLRFTAANASAGPVSVEQFAQHVGLRWLQQTYESQVVTVVE